MRSFHDGVQTPADDLSDRARVGIKTEHVLAGTLSTSMVAQMALVFGWPIPSTITWSIVAAAGAATVLSYATLAEYFPREASGRANAALNIMHVGMAFLLQSVTGLIIEQWPGANDRYPADAHQCAMGLILVLQVCAVVWFGLASRRPSRVAPSLRRLVQELHGHADARERNELDGVQFVRRTGNHTKAWQTATVASALVCIALMACLMLGSSHAGIAAHVIEVSASRR